MNKIIYFNRNHKAGFSINKVSQTYIAHIENKEILEVPSHCASFRDIIVNILFVFKNRKHNVINHITGDIHYCLIALIGCRNVLTIHDTVLLDYCKSSKLKYRIAKLLWFTLPLKIATRVVCISDVTRQHVLKYTKRKDIQVIHNAVDPSFKTILKNQTKTPYDILFIGTKANKNLERTIEALKGISCKLTIVGRLSDQQIDFLKKSKINYINKVNLTDEELLDEYINTDIVSFISLFEGFGMPIVEANKVGRPVITSTIPVLKEVGGNSCVFVDPKNIEDMHNGFVKLFTDSSLREICVQRGLENVKRFEVEHIVKQWKNLYNTL